MLCAGCQSLGSEQGHLLEKDLHDGQKSLGPKGIRSLGCPHPAEGILLAPVPPTPPRGLYIDYKYIRGKGVGGEGLWGWGLTSPSPPSPGPLSLGPFVKKE